jgi:GGDEF domain-containing protein
MLTALSAPHRIGPQALQVTGSIGVSIYPEDGETETS